jgi:hypothetical protein
MSPPTASADHVDRELVEYGPISGWALAALLLGILSGAAIAGPILWFVPVVALVVSLIALKKIRASDRQLSGWHVALLGLLLAIFFGIAGPARTISRIYLLQTRAARFADKFVELLQQHQQLLAFQITLPSGSRKPLAADETDPYAGSPETKKAYDSFLQLPAVQELLAAGSQAKAELLSATLVGSDEFRDDLILKYRLTDPQNPAAKFKIIGMSVRRTLANGSQTEQWQITPPSLQTAND